MNKALDSRAEAGLSWAAQVLGQPALQTSVAASDASARRYLPLIGSDPALLLMDSPPAQVALQPWLQIAELLEAHGLRVPKVHAADPANGFALIEHLGERLFQVEQNTAHQQQQIARVEGF